MSRVRVLGTVAGLATLGAVGFGCARKAPTGAPAADFTLKDLAGTEVRLAQFSGKPVLLSFWAVD
ncbi:MAG: redoxin domain-containing protein [bacterium]|nr:redoxin domain-containing protein [bacterium]